MSFAIVGTNARSRNQEFLLNFRSAAISGMAWSMMSQATRMVLQFAATIILARLLAPDDFGVFAMVLPIAALAGLLQDFGLNQAIIHKEGVTSEQVNAMFWLNLGLTCLIGIGLVALSPAVASFYGDDRVMQLVAAWSIVLLIGGLSFGQYAHLARAFKFKTLAIIDIICAVVSFATGIAIAFVWPSYWALFLSSLASVLCWTALTFATGTWRPGLPRLRVDLGGMFNFGMNLMIVNLAEFASRNADNVTVGRVLGSHALGLYDRAYKLLLYPMENLAAPLARVMIPVLSRMQGDPVQFRSAFLQMAGALGVIYIPGMVVAIGNSTFLVTLFLGEKWLPVVPVFYFLGFVGLLQPLISTATWLMISQGRTKQLLYVSVSSSCVIVASFLIGIQWGVTGVALSYAIAEASYRIPVLCYVSGKQGSVSRLDIISTFCPMLVGAGLGLIAIQWLEANGLTGWRLLLVSFAIPYAAVLISLGATKTGRTVLESIWRLASQALATVSNNLRARGKKVDAELNAAGERGQ